MPLHTLMFGWEYPPRHFGGLGVACHGLVNGLLKHDIHVTLVLPFAAEDESGLIEMRFPSEEQKNTIRVKSLLLPYDSEGSYGRRVRLLPGESTQIYGEDLAHAVHIFTETSVELTKDLSPDIVHCHDWMTFGAGVRVAEHMSRPLVAHVHATELDRTHFHPNEWIYGHERWGLKQANHIITVSNYTKNILVQHYGIPADKISVIHNASEYVPLQDIPHGQEKKRHPMVLFLGRLATQKGPLHFLAMAAQVHALRPDVMFVVTGEGHMLPSLINYTIKLGLQDCVMFTGRASNAEVHRLFTEANCFVMPSLSEPFGLVALEAIAHGTPVILSKQSGASEVIGHAFKVDFWDIEKMADCVLTILREQPLAEQLSAEAPRVLQKLTWEKQAGHVRSIYENTIRNYSPPSLSL